LWQRPDLGAQDAAKARGYDRGLAGRDSLNPLDVIAKAQSP
jgi:hypothetical protein